MVCEGVAEEKRVGPREIVIPWVPPTSVRTTWSTPCSFLIFCFAHTGLHDTIVTYDGASDVLLTFAFCLRSPGADPLQHDGEKQHHVTGGKGDDNGE